LRACTPTNADAVVIVFARAPVAGRAKTRLAARLGDAGAARLQARLTGMALRTALASRCGPVELHATSQHAFLVHVTRRLNVTLREQRGRDLGERMDRAIRTALRRCRSVVLIGSDCPELRPADLRRAVRWLQSGSEVVLAPAEDGGYALVAARRVAAGMFSDIGWGSSQVYAQSAKRLDGAGCRWRALRTVWDVDRPEDLERLRWLRFSSATGRCARR
jgi:rSAM/selenodomain-associated transferase 1